MRTQISPVFTFAALVLVLLSTACDPCGGDSIRINRSDRSAPELLWEITISAETPSGPISSIALFTDPDVTITLGANETAEIVLIAEDPQSGINWIDLQGGFGYTCSQPGGALALDGIIPGNRVYFDLGEENCAVAEGSYPTYLIDGPTLCFASYPNLSGGGYELRGSATNANGIFRQNRLFVQITGSGI